MARLRPKNWLEFQHYKDRAPPWIKLHRKMLDDRAFNSLPLASMALAPFLWLLASESKDGWFNGSIEEIAFRLRWKPSNVEAGLSGLISSGFFDVEHDASAPLAECQQPATPETERETQVQRERERQNIPRASRFSEFWEAYPRKIGKAKAERLFEGITKKASPDLLIAGAIRYCTSQADTEQKFIAHPSTWLSQRRWEDDPEAGQQASAEVISIRSAFTSPEELEGQRRALERLHGKAAN